MNQLIKFIQQPESIHSLMALVLASRGMLKDTITKSDIDDFFSKQGIQINQEEMDKRWEELPRLGMAQKVPTQISKIGFIITQTGEAVFQVLADALDYTEKVRRDKAVATATMGEEVEENRTLPKKT